MCISVNGTTTTLLLGTIYTHTVYTSRVVAVLQMLLVRGTVRSLRHSYTTSRSGKSSSSSKSRHSKSESIESDLNSTSTNSKSKLIFFPLPEDDPKRRRPNIELAREKFEDWEPKIKLKEGLIKTIDYFEKIV